MKICSFPRVFSVRKGFTLIEVCLVIALILGLLAIVAVGLGYYQRASQGARCIMTVSGLVTNARSVTMGAMESRISGIDDLNTRLGDFYQEVAANEVCPG